ncbi:MAG: hypothetical protein HYZ37_14750 [Candidatus Solibacter usitatus]|nr:hypothetical protein [Candidatus Solibacter usitatus]
MMQKNISLEEDIYEFLRHNCDFGETPSGVLRRLLHLPSLPPGEISFYDNNPSPVVVYSHSGDAVEAKREQNPPVTMESSTNGAVRAIDSELNKSALMLFIEGPSLRIMNSTDKYLLILGFVHKEKQGEFEKVLGVTGRRRRYFGCSSEEIDGSGTSTHPRLIPNSGYWAMTNADTNQKCEMLRKVLEVFGYSPAEIKAAVSAIV